MGRKTTGKNIRIHMVHKLPNNVKREYLSLNQLATRTGK